MFLTCSAFAQKRSIALKLKKDSTYSFVVKQTTTTSQTIRQRSLETRMTLLVRMSFKIADVRKDHYRIYAKYDSINLHMDMPNGNLQYSSENSDTTNIYSQILAAFKNKAFLVRLSRSGQIISADEADQYLSVIAQLTKANAAQREQAFTELQQSIGSNAVVNLLQKVFNVYPEVPVNSNEKWVIDTKSEGEPDLATRNYYVIKNILPKNIIIQGNGTIRSLSPTEPALLNGMPVERNLAGDTYVNISADKVSGWPLKAEVMEKLSGFMIIQDNSKLPGGLAIPVNINNIVTVDIP
ncbi:DUF6263 family protein [Mucilaginibacter roseus]|uniref:DUF6263 family protein n=1 Tax=Mucilaginibacter roseus TaxID=1528868 RepID=A0ABS8U535_9SPHI|nr:DUF6263 family protein [Mucilaginibacter roseus]MCD8741742.1 DUF6263 family protein [Mucilaginibacter roseus]